MSNSFATFESSALSGIACIERDTSSKLWEGNLGEGKAAGDEVGDGDSAMAWSTARQLFEVQDNSLDENE